MIAHFVALLADDSQTSASTVIGAPKNENRKRARHKGAWSKALVTADEMRQKTESAIPAKYPHPTMRNSSRLTPSCFKGDSAGQGRK